jgi:hypothetical protein
MDKFLITITFCSRLGIDNGSRSWKGLQIVEYKNPPRKFIWAFNFSGNQIKSYDISSNQNGSYFS